MLDININNYEDFKHSKLSDLSYGQQALYFMQQYNPESTSYNIGMAFKFYDKFKENSFRSTIKTILSMHQILKTKFINNEGKIYQYIDAEDNYDLFVTNVEGWTEKRIASKVNQDFHTSYNLLKDNLLRIYLYKNTAYTLVNFVCHHIITDFNSIEILLDHFIRIYYSKDKNLELNFNNTDITYNTFVMEEKEFICSESFNAKINNWKRILTGLNDELDFNLETEQCSNMHITGDKVPFQINRVESQRLLEVCDKYHISPFLFFLTVYELFLYQVFGKKDVVVGVPVNLRRNVKYRRVLGNFVNVLPVRMRITGEGFIENAIEVKKAFVEAMLNKKVPYSLLVEHINPGRDKKNPIFQTTFNYLSKRLSENDLVLDQNINDKQTMLGYEIEAYPIEQQLDQVDLALEFNENIQGFTGIFKYNKNMFNQELVTDYVSRYQSLLHRVLEHVNGSVENLRYANEKEREELISITGQNRRKFPKFSNVTEMIEASVSKNSRQIAVRDEDTCLTYGQLNDKANRFAGYLISYGIKKGNPVIVFMDRQIEVVIALLAIIKIGAIYVPIDTSFPQNRIEYILESTSSSCIITTKKLMNIYDFLRNAVCIDLILLKPDAGWSKAALIMDTEVNQEDSAYIIFTSGSTGKPKGVEIQHKALVNFLQAMEEVLGLKDKKNINIGGITSISFDISILEFLLPLAVGGQATLLAKKLITDANIFEEYIQKFGITVFQATSTTWNMILDMGWHGNKSMDVLVGGEMVSRDLALKLTSKFRKVWNVYGPTEATIWATAKLLSKQDKLVSAGLPIPNMEAYILDENFHVMQKNVAGKLYLAGAGLGKGYYKKEELTNERFFDIQLEGIIKRVYDTGDLAKYLDNGELQILGRNDDQIKLSGYRIELGEIESVLDKYYCVKKSAVLIKEQKLVAYIVSKHEEQVFSVKELRSYCSRYLTPYMVPSEFILIDIIPLTPNQKTDRKALSTMKGKQINDPLKENLIPNGMQKEIFGIWKEVLGNSGFGENDNFFDFGGTSLLAMALHQKINNRMKVPIALSDIFTYPTIHLLSEYLCSKTMSEPDLSDREEIRRGKNRLAVMRKRKGNSL